MPRRTTEGEMIALRALEEPRKMQPKIMTQTVVRRRAFRGTPRVGCTRAKTLEAGRPSSLRAFSSVWDTGAGEGWTLKTDLAKAQVIRLLVVVMLRAAKRRQTSGKLQSASITGSGVSLFDNTHISKQIEPPRLLVALKRI